MRTETWGCNGRPISVRVDDSGCPIDQKFCKTQAGGRAGTLAAPVGIGAAFTITIQPNNFTRGKVKGLVMSADSPAGVVTPVVLENIVVTSIRIQGDEQLGNNRVNARRYRADSTGAKMGTGQMFNGEVGSAAGAFVLQGINRSTVTVLVFATIDVNAIRGA